jgi:serine/threonine protein kinase
MAEVYKAYHPGLECYVAIKVLHPFLAGEKDFLARFEREARVVATFRHPNIIQVYDYESNVEDRCYYMVMEFIDGPSLKTRLRDLGQEGRRLPLDEAIRIVIAVANALDYAHRHGMVHRDIKPANIMFTQDGQVILTDFGIARMVDTTPLTASGAMVGTPAYMAPEQGMGRVRDERADIYSLGVMFYQLATGNLPFDADTPMAIVLKHIHAPLLPPTTLNPGLPPAVEAVIMRALAKDPDKRYQSARSRQGIGDCPPPSVVSPRGSSQAELDRGAGRSAGHGPAWRRRPPDHRYTRPPAGRPTVVGGNARVRRNWHIDAHSHARPHRHIRRPCDRICRLDEHLCGDRRRDPHFLADPLTHSHVHSDP